MIGYQMEGADDPFLHGTNMVDAPPNPDKAVRHEVELPKGCTDIHGSCCSSQGMQSPSILALLLVLVLLHSSQ